MKNSSEKRFTSGDKLETSCKWTSHLSNNVVSGYILNLTSLAPDWPRTQGGGDGRRVGGVLDAAALAQPEEVPAQAPHPWQLRSHRWKTG